MDLINSVLTTVSGIGNGWLKGLRPPAECPSQNGNSIGSMKVKPPAPTYKEMLDMRNSNDIQRAQIEASLKQREKLLSEREGELVRMHRQISAEVNANQSAQANNAFLTNLKLKEVDGMQYLPPIKMN